MTRPTLFDVVLAIQYPFRHAEHDLHQTVVVIEADGP
jgi:hypothetical protein